MIKPKYIKRVEKDEQIFSVLTIESLSNNIEQFLDKLKSTLVNSTSKIDYESGQIKYYKKIYKTSQGFYIYLSHRDTGTLADINFYYKQGQLDEITLFVGQLLKQFKNYTIS